LIDSEKLKKEYIDWVKDNTSFKSVGNNTMRIDTPFTDNSNDDITMYLMLNSDGKSITITDDGWTIDNLESKGLNLTRSTKRKKLLDSQLKMYGAYRRDDELFIDGYKKDFALLKSRFTQAILFTYDMYLLAPQNAKNIFMEDVDLYFKSHDVRTVNNASYVGIAGLSHKFEFTIPSSNKEPMRLVKVLSSGNNSMIAKSIYTDFTQVEGNINEVTKNFIFINDRNRKNKKIDINPDILELFRNDDITPVPFSERESYTEQFVH
jgi:hypothetical protein